MLHLAKKGSLHTINELEVATLLELNSDKDFKLGDNSAIIATDTQKNTVYILAKQFGINTPEEFALRIAKHFIDKVSSGPEPLDLDKKHLLCSLFSIPGS